MLGSYGPNPTAEPYTKDFDPEESPSGTLARMGSFSVRSRVIDDDGEVYAGMSPDYRKHFFGFLTRMDRVGMGFQACERVVNNWCCFFPLVPASSSGILYILQFRIVLHVLSSLLCMFLRVVSGCYPFLYVLDPLTRIRGRDFVSLYVHRIVTCWQA